MASSDGVHGIRRVRGVIVSVPRSCRGWQRACRARYRVVMALNALAAAVGYARRNFGLGPGMTGRWPGGSAWRGSSCPSPPGDHLPPVPCTGMPAAGPATLTAPICSASRDTVTS